MRTGRVGRRAPREMPSAFKRAVRIAPRPPKDRPVFRLGRHDLVTVKTSNVAELVAPLFKLGPIVERLAPHPQGRANAAPPDDQIDGAEKRPLLAQDVTSKAVSGGVHVAKFEHVHGTRS